MTETDWAVELAQVSVWYGQIRALRDVSLRIAERDFLGIIGPNGSGKSTLLKVILGMLPAHTGRVSVFGRPPGCNRERMGYVPQFTNLNRSFPARVLDLVLMGKLPKSPRPFFRYSSREREQARAALQQLGLADLAERHLSQLSGGQLQRILIARALMSKPDILLLDEPTASVDSQAKLTIYDTLVDLQGQGLTIIVVSHDITALTQHVSHIACLDQTLHYHGAWPFDQQALAQTQGCNLEMLLAAMKKN